MKINKKILLLSLSFLLIILLTILAVWFIFSYNKNVKSDVVLVKNIKISEDDSVSFVLVNYKKIPVNCSAVLQITQDSSLVVETEEALGVVKPRQKMGGIISEFEMPQGISHINVIANCTDFV